ncbi:MAG: hypothetical protein VKL59_22890 [Nostocaceae cyanobacterium]|nr:hypothetical protein [Nostocaceae cyanobacterium]
MLELPKIWEMSVTDIRKLIMKGTLDISSHIKTWLENNMSEVFPEYLVIGSKIETDNGSVIDLLCLDEDAHLMVIELTHNNPGIEATANNLADALWVKELPWEKIEELAKNYFSNQWDLATAFLQNFGKELPEEIPDTPLILIIDMGIESFDDEAGYLNVRFTNCFPINADAFKKAQDSVDWTALLISRTLSLKPWEFCQYTPFISYGKKQLTKRQLEAIAVKNGVLDLYQLVVQGLLKYPFRTNTLKLRTFLTFTTPKKPTQTLFYINPGKSNPYHGLEFEANPYQFCEYLGISESEFQTFLPKYKIAYHYTKPSEIRVAGFFKTAAEINHFLTKLTEIRDKKL